MSLEDVEHLITLVMDWNSWPSERSGDEWAVNNKCDWRVRIDTHKSTEEVLCAHVRGAEDCMKFTHMLFCQLGTEAFPKKLTPPYLDFLMSTAT